MMTRFLLVSACVAGLVAAQPVPPQGPAPGDPPRRGFGPGGPGGRGFGGPMLGGPMSEQRLTRRLSLNAEQQNKVHTAIEESRVMLRGMGQQERDLRTQLATAVKSGDEGGIDRASRDLANIHQQRLAVEAKAVAKIYGALNADQKSQMEREVNRFLGAPGPRAPRDPNAPRPRVRQQ